MRTKHSKDRKLYYVLLNKETNIVRIGTTKQLFADVMNINVRTINRNIQNGVYENDTYILWSNISIEKCVKGFARKRK